MKIIQSLVLATIVLGTSACASTATKQQPTVSSSALETTSVTAAAIPADSPHAIEPNLAAKPSPAPADGPSPEASPPTGAEAPDSAQPNDPWEGYNRGMYSFNTKVDKYVMRPIGVVYDKVMPDVVQRRITSFFANLQEPRTMVNQVLQGRPVGAAKTLGRFVVNTTAGVGGIFDPASGLKLDRANEDLGQTLAVWGWEDSRYFVAPLQGPKTVRDFVGGFGDKPLNPTGYIEDSGVSMGVTLLKIGSMRAAALPLDQMRAGALDEYAFVRDMWMKKRQSQIQAH
jgi:phospholipid-binding lipoprotein MlaA